MGIKRENEERRYRVVSRCRRHLPFRANIHERSPLITHWLATSDEEPESFHTPPENIPNIPNRVRVRVPSDSFDRIDVLGTQDL